MDTFSHPLIAIVGQTASGKSALAMRLAQKYRGEIIAADSRTVYRGMDIGTAKPTINDRELVPHHGIDLIEPDETYSAAQFKQLAHALISQIHSRNNIPIIVGGTGLYVDGLLYDFQFGAKANPALRKELSVMTMENLQRRARAAGINETDVSFKNRRHLSRAIERGDSQRRRSNKLPSNILLIGIIADKADLSERIEARVEHMVLNGFADEVKKLLKKYPLEVPGLLAPGYKAFGDYIHNDIDLKEAKKRFVQNDKRLAKRQNTWFKRNSDIVWVQSFEHADTLVSNFLRKFDTIRQ